MRIFDKININTENLTEFSGKAFLFQNFIDIDSTNELLLQTTHLSKRRVICNIPNVSYEEQQIEEASNLYSFFCSDPVTSISQNILETDDELSSMLCWTSIYKKNEFINPHKDASGDLQILLCLQNDGCNDEGLFCFQIDDTSYKIFLNPGDLIFFKATEIEHFTTPLLGTLNNQQPQRIVAVARQFFN